MSPTPSFHDHHAKTSINVSLCPPPLKINKDSHMIKKSSSSSLSSPPSSSSSSSGSSSAVAGPAKPPQQQRHPVIIYTHSPKIIHTHPRDFMALVQKLTGISRTDDDDERKPQVVKQEKGNPTSEEDKKNLKIVGNEDNESSSVITDENSAITGDGSQVNSCFVPPIFEPPNPYMTNIPVFTPNSADFLCANQHHHRRQPFYSYTDSLYFTSPANIRSSISSSPSPLEGINEFREY
ncbi:VQ motif-containing protein 20 [Mercurialis annua]|uniref:VQ motif-containing protein 20 n=1 Tax=Mercurialis annua TaxID=3986 RepID=UPI002160B798|nr:VQ motif-containing protein 20 [Mercurialis annua]